MRCYIIHTYAGKSYLGVTLGGGRAFATRQGAENWIKENPPRYTDWRYEVEELHIYD